MKLIDTDKIIEKLVNSLADNIASLMDEYTIFFLILSFFLMIVALSVIDRTIQVIHFHSKSLFQSIASIWSRIWKS